MALFGDGGLGNIADAGAEAADVVGVSREASERSAFSRDFNVGNFDSFGGSVTPGKFVEIARYEVPADTEYAWGYGRSSAPENQGYIYVDLQSATPNPTEGTLRFKVESSTGRRTEVVKDLDTEKLDASKTDRTQQVPIPEQVNSALATQDAYLVVELDAASTNTDQEVDSGESEVIIPVTEYDLS
jgi:hypothetical protein